MIRRLLSDIGDFGASGSVDVASVIDADDRYFMAGVVDAVDRGRCPSGGPDTGEILSELSPYSPRVVQQHPGEEVDDGDRDRFGYSSARARAAGRATTISYRSVTTTGASGRTASTPRMTSPWATAASPSRRPAIASGSLNTASVSSRLPRSSVLISTIAGRPFE